MYAQLVETGMQRLQSRAEMSAEERAAFHANYIRGGPAGRPAPADA